MMLEVDIESNRILVTELLLVAPQATNDNDDRGRNHRTSRSGYDSSYVIAHFLMGVVVLCILVVVVFQASRHSLAECESTRSEGGGGFANDTTIAGILVGSFLDCNNTPIIGVN